MWDSEDHVETRSVDSDRDHVYPDGTDEGFEEAGMDDDQYFFGKCTFFVIEVLGKDGIW